MGRCGTAGCMCWGAARTFCSKGGDVKCQSNCNPTGAVRQSTFRLLKTTVVCREDSEQYQWFHHCKRAAHRMRRYGWGGERERERKRPKCGEPLYRDKCHGWTGEGGGSPLVSVNSRPKKLLIAGTAWLGRLLTCSSGNLASAKPRGQPPSWLLAGAAGGVWCAPIQKKCAGPEQTHSPAPTHVFLVSTRRIAASLCVGRLGWGGGRREGG
jgi:hypothetical protein